MTTPQQADIYDDMTVRQLIGYLMWMDQDAQVAIWSPGAIVTGIKGGPFNDPSPQVYLIIEEAG